MVEPNWGRHSLRLGLVGVQRNIRGLRRQRARLRLIGLSFVCFVIVLGGFGTLFALSLRLHEGPIAVPGEVRVAVTVFWLFAVWFFSQRALLYWRSLRSKAFILTTVSARTAVVGMLITEFLSECIVFALPTVALVGVVGYAFVHPISVLLIPLAVILFGASATVVGYAFGFTYLHLITQSRTIAQRNLSIVMQLLVLVLTGYVLLRAFVPAIDLPELSGFTWLPIGWLVDLATIGTPVTASLIRAMTGLLGVLIVIFGGTVVVEQLATAYWYGDPTTPNQTTTEDRDSSLPSTEMDPLAAAISPLVVPDALSTPTQAVARLALIRLRRAPRRLSLLIGIVVSFAGSFGIAAVQTENPLALVPIGCAVVLPWLVGATFGLNPLGDEGAVLPATLTSSISGGQFVRGLMVPGLLYGLPLTVICTLVSNLFSPYSPVEQVGLVVFSAVLTVAAVTFAPAIGMAFPRFSAINVGQRGEAIPPSLIAVLVYSIIVGIVSGIALITLFVPILRVNSVSPATMRLGVFGVTLAIMVCFSYQAYRSAAKRFATHTIE